MLKITGVVNRIFSSMPCWLKGAPAQHMRLEGNFLNVYNEIKKGSKTFQPGQIVEFSDNSLALIVSLRGGPGEIDFLAMRTSTEFWGFSQPVESLETNAPNIKNVYELIPEPHQPIIDQNTEFFIRHPQINIGIASKDGTIIWPVKPSDVKNRKKFPISFETIPERDEQGFCFLKLNFVQNKSSFEEWPFRPASVIATSIHQANLALARFSQPEVRYIEAMNLLRKAYPDRNWPRTVLQAVNILTIKKVRPVSQEAVQSYWEWREDYVKQGKNPEHSFYVCREELEKAYNQATENVFLTYKVEGLTPPPQITLTNYFNDGGVIYTLPSDPRCIYAFYRIIKNIEQNQKPSS